MTSRTLLHRVFCKLFILLATPMEISYQPYIDPDLESIIERINPPRVCIDNEACENCTLVKVDSVNKDGILLDMVQVLTDLDLVISKSYISSDGGWLMDVFHVTDGAGKKLTEGSLLSYIQQVMCTNSETGTLTELKAGIKREVRPFHVSMDHTALEITGTDRPGLLSEISAAITELEFHITAGVAWTHSNRVACIVYIEDEIVSGSLTTSERLAKVVDQLENVIEARHGRGERRSVRLSVPAATQTHTERRLHQMLCSDFDYEPCHGCEGREHRTECAAIHVSIEPFKEKGYTVVNVRSRDRPKLLFDTVCALTDAHYVVFHASVSSRDAMAVQEYFIRPKSGYCTLDTESGRSKLTQCLIAALERRLPHGVRLEISTEDRIGLLADVTRAIRENGLSISRAEIGRQAKKAIGTFYVADATGGMEVSPQALQLVRNEIGESVVVINRSPEWTPRGWTRDTVVSRRTIEQEKAQFSLASLIRSQFERLSSNFGSIRS